MASSSIALAAKWLGKLVVEEVELLGEVKDKVEDLQSELEWMQCFLWDADKQQSKNNIVKKWVSDIRDFAVEAEYLVETYILGVNHKRPDQQIPQTDINKINAFLNCWVPIYRDLKWLAKLSCSWEDGRRLHNVATAIASLTSKISRLTSRLQTYGIKIDNTTASYHSKSWRRAYPHAVDPYVVGLEDLVNKLVEDFLSVNNNIDDNRIKVMVIHGMGGIGKTTLARKVYNDSRRQMKDKFAGFAWVYVSQDLHVESVCRDILLQFIPEREQEERNRINRLSSSELPRKLCQVLKERDYLVVLDDVWSSRDWRCLEPAFPLYHDRDHQHDEQNNCNGSKLLVTTRNRQILSHLGDDIVHYFEAVVLDRNRSWELLKEKAGLTQEVLADPKMLELGNKMLDHCNGLPLAIVVLGVLGTKKHEEWESVYDNLFFHLQGDDDEAYTGVYEVLALSYHELPYHIKPCFLQLGNFPEDFEIPTQRLYDLWIAEGTVASAHDRVRIGRRSLEEVAEVYLNQLVQKSMVQAGNKDSDGRMLSCRMHDLMRDKCLELGREEIYLQLVDHNMNQNDDFMILEGRVRRLAISVDAGNNHSEATCRCLGNDMPLMRSLLLFPDKQRENDDDAYEENCEWIKKRVCKDFQLIRILDFTGVVLKGSLPAEIGKYLFLRYLSLKDTQITELPSSIGNLKSLLILDLRVKDVVIKLPNVLWNMRYLRHLYLASKHLSQEPGTPKRGYQILDAEPLKLHKLSSLEMLEDVDLDRVNLEGLLELTSIRKLSALCASSRDKLVPFLRSSSINYLSLKIHARILLEDEMLLSGCNSLKKLDIEADRIEITILPSIKLAMFPSNLVELAFWYCILGEDPMPVLEQLPKLKHLSLRICYYGSKIVCSANGFPELTYLALDGLFVLSEWQLAEGGLPKLEWVEIYNSRLRMLPEALPQHVSVSCMPCVPGTEKHGTCSYLPNSATAT